MPFSIVLGDITQMRVDAVVNAANPALQMGGGVCGAIFRAAGASELQAACDALGGCKTGQAVITPGFGLPAKYIIHTPGPVWEGGARGEEALLRSCYANSLLLAERHGLESVAFPLISSGIYGYPRSKALKAASGAIRDFLSEHDMDVYLVMLDRDAVDDGSPRLGAVEAFLGENYLGTKPSLFHRLMDAEREQVCGDSLHPCAAPAARPASGLNRALGNLDEPFSRALLHLIDAKGRTDTEIYKRANIDRRLFSKIRTNPQYMPGKRTVLALSVALELTLDETKELLERAGYALSRSQKFDVIVEYFIQNGRYDVFEINETLFYYDQPLLGS